MFQAIHSSKQMQPSTYSATHLTTEYSVVNAKIVSPIRNVIWLIIVSRLQSKSGTCLQFLCLFTRHQA